MKISKFKISRCISRLTKLTVPIVTAPPPYIALISVAVAFVSLF